LQRSRVERTIFGGLDQRSIEVEDAKQPKVMVLIRFKSSLTPDELERRYKERLPQFRALPGLLQKYYVQGPAADEWGGVYIWDSQESLDRYMESDLRKSIPDVYEIVGTPSVQAIPIIDTLRP
jgi:hypothetical protein